MVSSAAKSVPQYLTELPPERRDVVAKVRKLILENLTDAWRGIVDVRVRVSEHRPHRIRDGRAKARDLVDRDPDARDRDPEEPGQKQGSPSPT